MSLTAVRGKRGRRVHAWMPVGERRDLAPEDIPSLVCGRRLAGALIVEENVDCDACLQILFIGN